MLLSLFQYTAIVVKYPKVDNFLDRLECLKQKIHTNGLISLQKCGTIMIIFTSSIPCYTLYALDASFIFFFLMVILIMFHLYFRSWHCTPTSYSVGNSVIINEVVGGILVWLRQSVCPSVPHSVFALWLIASFMDCIHMLHKYNPSGTMFHTPFPGQ